MSTYKTYIESANKHLNACFDMIDGYQHDIPYYTLLDAYYLSGYIIEGICVYAIYKYYEWDENKDIKVYDELFTSETDLDFYKLRRGSYTIPKYNIEHHNFQHYVQILHPILSSEAIPYISPTTEISSKVKRMIDMWNPTLRYKSPKEPNIIDTDSLEELLDVCKIMYKKIIQLV